MTEGRAEGEPAADAGPVGPLAGWHTAPATFGLVAAGCALAALFITGEAGTGAGTVVVRLAGVAAVVAFALRRRTLLPARPGAAVAGLSSLVVLAGDVLVVFGHLTAWRHPFGLPLAGAAAGLAIAYAVADATGVAARAATRGSIATAVAGAVGVAGFLGASIVAAVAISVAPSITAIVPGTTPLGARYVVATAGSGVGFGLFALASLHVTDREPRAYIDLRWPTTREVGIAAAGVLALIVANEGASLAIEALDLPFAESQIQTQAAAQGSGTFLLYLIPLTFLATAPGEELIYRNIVQKSLYDPLGRWAAVLVASAVFAVIHGAQYASAAPGATAVSLSLVFALALVLAVVYERTDNLVVPMLVHAVFNAYSFALMYAAITA